MLANLQRNLKLVIFGQDAAIDALAAAIKMSRAGLRRRAHPVGSFLFAGPTGVGKTEVTRQLAIALGVEFLRFDMSEYMERHTVSRLIGAPPGYVGFDQGGLLTEAIGKQPHCVLLLDEIEKAHPDVFNLLLQVMDHGTLTDNNGRKADFRHVIIVMTTNAGAAEMGRASIGFTQQDHASDGMEAVRRMFSPEFRNRIDAIIQFAPLDAPTDRARGRQARHRDRGAARAESRDRCRSTTLRGAGSPSVATTRRWARARWRGCCRSTSSARWRRSCCSASWRAAATSSSGWRPAATASCSTSDRSSRPSCSGRNEEGESHARAVDDAALGEVVGRQFDRHRIAGQDPDVVLAHLARDVGGDHVIVLRRTRNVVLGRVSTTSPSIWIASSLAIAPRCCSGNRADCAAGRAHAQLNVALAPHGHTGIDSSARRASKSQRGMLRLPRLARCGLGIWQSISGTFRARHSETRRASATFEASVVRVNMDSPKNTRPSPTPYRPPTSRPRARSRTSGPARADAGARRPRACRA